MQHSRYHGRAEPTLREWLSLAPYTLAMSSGFFGFFAHLGLLEALENSQLPPTRISGSSAGALAGACWASGRSRIEIKKRLFGLAKSDFWDPGPGAGLLQGKLFQKLVAEICLVDTIEACKIPLKISAFDLSRLATHTFCKGSLSQAVYASCCVPFLFQPIRIGSSIYLDGGIQDRPGLCGIPLNNRVFYHHLPSNWPFRASKSRVSGILRNRPNTVALSIQHLHRVSPERLQRGQKAYDQARHAMTAALDQPLIDRHISL